MNSGEVKVSRDYAVGKNDSFERLPYFLNRFQQDRHLLLAYQNVAKLNTMPYAKKVEALVKRFVGQVRR